MTASSRKFRLVLLTVFGVLVLALVPAAFAGKGGGGSKPSGGGSGASGAALDLAIVTDTGSPGVSYDDTITFNVTDPATSEPHVQLQCFQSGTMVYTAVTGYYAGYPWPWTQNFQLTSGAWTGGAANCVATLYHFTRKGTATDATLSFLAGS